MILIVPRKIYYFWIPRLPTRPLAFKKFSFNHNCTNAVEINFFLPKKNDFWTLKNQFIWVICNFNFAISRPTIALLFEREVTFVLTCEIKFLNF